MSFSFELNLVTKDGCKTPNKEHAKINEHSKEYALQYAQFFFFFVREFEKLYSLI